MINFWQNLNKPIYALAPMAGWSDAAFRQICQKFGADVVYSEMVSAAGLTYQPVKSLRLLIGKKGKVPLVAQLFGSEPKHFVAAAQLLIDEKRLKELGFKNYCAPDGIDINLGCPVPKVRKQTAGCALFAKLSQARAVIEATIKAVDLPVSIKIRSQVGLISALEFLDYVRDLDIKAVMIHGRSLAQGFVGEIDYQLISQARSLVKGILLANGGVVDWQTAQITLQKTKADGLGIARGAFGRPWIFTELKNNQTKTISQAEILKTMLRHAQLFEQQAEITNTSLVGLRKHLLAYIRGWPQINDWRQQLIAVDNLAQLKNILANFKYT